MPTIYIKPSGLRLTAPAGAGLRQTLQDAGILLDYPCGGKGSCRQCRIYVDPPPSSGKGKLPESETTEGVRLACQLTLEGDCTVTIPEERLSKKLWKQGIRDEDITISLDRTSVRRSALTMQEPSLQDQRPDWERLTAALEAEGIRHGNPDAFSLDSLSEILRRDAWRAEAFSEDGDFLWIAPDTGARAFGLAVDLGTTTVDMALLDLESGKRLARRAFLNRQVSFGADVISRAQAFHTERGPVRKAALDTIQEGADMLLRECGIKPSQLLKTVVVGNPIMIHILAGIDPFTLTLYPYVPIVSRSLRAPPRDYGWDFQKHGYVETLPLISAYVGADTIGMIVSLDLEQEKKTSLSIDIGTNGEMVLARHGKLVATSTAAGPAFEGAQISCGMRALEGAVYGMSIDDEGVLANLTVGNAPPRGICGTGLVAGIAQMLERGIIDSTGRLLEAGEIELPALRERVFSTGGELAFALSEDRKVFISQSDVRKLQLAKGAVRTGIETLLEVEGMKSGDLDSLRLAGNFGAGLDPAAAMRIGLIPTLDRRKVQVVGNAALRGAVLAALSREYERKAESAARNGTFIELGAKAEFQAHFAESMMFE